MREDPLDHRRFERRELDGLAAHHAGDVRDRLLGCVFDESCSFKRADLLGLELVELVGAVLE